MKPATFIICVVALNMLCANAKADIGIERKGDILEIRNNGQKIMVYAFGTNQYKPYIRELYTLRGESVLLDSPRDHVHHHGLMYAIGVNGINFWEEQKDPGVEKSIDIRTLGTRGIRGLVEASFTHLIHWVARTNRALADTKDVALLIEHRTITLTVDEKKEEVAVQWKSDFTVGPKMEKVVLTGSSYFGLGVRFPRSFDHVCEFANSENKPYLGEKPGDVIQAKWTSVAGKLDGNDVMVMLAGKTSNRGGETYFYTMKDAFAYMTATQNLYKAPIEYAAKDHFSLNYLFAVYSKTQTTKSLNSRFEQWDKTK